MGALAADVCQSLLGIEALGASGGSWPCAGMTAKNSRATDKSCATDLFVVIPRISAAGGWRFNSSNLGPSLIPIYRFGGPVSRVVATKARVAAARLASRPRLPARSTRLPASSLPSPKQSKVRKPELLLGVALQFGFAAACLDYRKRGFHAAGFRRLSCAIQVVTIRTRVKNVITASVPE